jgi:hypothetical protein
MQRPEISHRRRALNRISCPVPFLPSHGASCLPVIKCLIRQENGCVATLLDFKSGIIDFKNGDTLAFSWSHSS